MKCYVSHQRTVEPEVLNFLDRVVLARGNQHVRSNNRDWSRIGRDTRRVTQRVASTLFAGEAVYFLGGRKALYRSLVQCPHLNINTARMAQGIRIAGFFGITLKSLGYFGTIGQIRSKTLSLLCVYNSDLGGRMAPNRTMDMNRMGVEFKDSGVIDGDLNFRVLAGQIQTWYPDLLLTAQQAMDQNFGVFLYD
jgi:hypothetical protein